MWDDVHDVEFSQDMIQLHRQDGNWPDLYPLAGSRNAILHELMDWSAIAAGSEQPSPYIYAFWVRWRDGEGRPHLLIDNFGDVFLLTDGGDTVERIA
jgi:hypothetical protein